MHWLVGDWTDLGEVAAKAALMYGAALLALRLGERRTVAQWRSIDFATAVAMGAIIGRTAIAGTQPYVTGAVAVVALVVIHCERRSPRPRAAQVRDHRERPVCPPPAAGLLQPRRHRVCVVRDERRPHRCPRERGSVNARHCGTNNAAGWPPQPGSAV